MQWSQAATSRRAMRVVAEEEVETQVAGTALPAEAEEQALPAVAPPAAARELPAVAAVAAPAAAHCRWASLRAHLLWAY